MEIIKAADVRQALEDQKSIIVDARGGPDAFERFRSAHIENALFVNLETDLSVKSENAAHGGRHPLPAPRNLRGTAGKFRHYARINGGRL